MQKKFSVGDEVKWTSQSGGYEKTKTGTVVFVIPANAPAWTRVGRDQEKIFDLRTDLSGTRREESYLVTVAGKSIFSRKLLYWPRTKNLERINDAS